MENAFVVLDSRVWIVAMQFAQTIAQIMATVITGHVFVTIGGVATIAL
jgi:hypothetical protein